MSTEQVWAAYKNTLHAFVQSKVSNPADAEELLQDILLKTHTQIHQLNDARNVKSWLFTLAHNAVIDFYRRAGAAAIETELGDITKESETSVRTNLVKCIEPFLSNLAQEDADLIRRIDLEGQSQKVEADKLGLSYSTFKSRVKKSRAKLKAQFDLCCNFEIDKRGNLIEYQRKDSNRKRC